MNVTIASITKSFVRDEAGQELTAEQLIVYEARVSNPNNQLNTATAPRLLAYCIRKKHWSVFDQADVTVEITTSRAIAAQILRHHSFRFQEFSQRYAKVTQSEPIELRKPGATSRQSSEEPLGNAALDERVTDHISRSFLLYEECIDRGASNETARFVLPLSTRTRLYMKGSIRSWIHYLMVREEPNTQKEHRQVANAVRPIIEEHFPNVMAAVDMVLNAKRLRFELARLAAAAKPDADGKMDADAPLRLAQFVVENVDDLVLGLEA